ncbi:MAG TPA: NAD-binding protein, partial [Acidimicrobiales bacterium]|nr:NAD-binding protein [Acidimicrobiales bacterium]
MKSLAFLLAYLSTPMARRNIRVLAWLHVVLVVVVALYSTLFHVIMAREGQSHSWPTSVYWTLVTMSTLGFGDITFQSDLGRLFSVVVLLSGALFILVLLPFTFIQFVYVPIMDARQRNRAPRQLPEETSGHVILTRVGPIENALIRRLDRSSVPYVVIVGDLDEALGLHDRGYEVMVGELDDPAAYRAARAGAAALVAATGSDTANTNVAFTVREISEQVRILAIANSPDAVDILELAGCDRVLQLGEMLGRALAQRVLGPDGRSQVIGEFGDLLIAEAVAPEVVVGSALREADLRRRLGINVVGV